MSDTFFSIAIIPIDIIRPVAVPDVEPNLKVEELPGVGALEEGLEGLDLAVGAAAVPVTRLVLNINY